MAQVQALVDKVSLRPAELELALVGVAAVYSYLTGKDQNQKKEATDKDVDEAHMNKKGLKVAGSGIAALIVPALILTDLYLSPLSTAHPLTLLPTSPSGGSTTFPTPRLRTLRLLGYGAFISGGILRYWAMRTLGRYFTYRLTIRQGHRVIREGPYSIVRNPSYTGSYVMDFGLAVILSTGRTAIGLGVDRVAPWFNLAAGLGAMVYHYRRVFRKRIPGEEKMLADAFGDDWEAYKREVPYRLIPFVY